MPSDDYTEMNELLHDTWAAWNPWMKEAKEDLKYYLGEQWTDAEKAYLDEQNRPHLVINKNIRRFVHLLTGYQRQNRLAIAFDPWEGSDSQTAEQFSQLALHSMEKGGGYHQVSRAFSPSLKVGLDWVNLFVDFNEDLENGDIKFKRTMWTKLMPDPLFQELDLSDANYLFRREYLTERQLQMLIPGKKVKNHFQPSNEMYGPIMDPGLNIMASEDRFLLTELWERDWKHKPYLLNAQTGETKRIEIENPKQEERLKVIMQQFPELRMFRKRDEIVKLRLFIGEDRIWKGEDPTGCEDFPYVPIIGYFDPEYEELKLKLQGIVRPLRDPARELNKRRSQLLHIINTIARTGWMWEEGAMSDESQMANASGAGVQIRLNEGGLEKIKEVTGASFPSDVVKVEEMFANDAVDISGVNAELLATMEKDIPGILAKLRQNQGLIMIQEIFDNLSYANKCLGNRFIKCVQNNYGPQKVQRIINATPSPQFYTKDFQKYDATADEAINSPSQKDANFHKLMWFHQNIAPVHPMVMLEVADIPEKYRDVQAQWMMQMLQSGMGGGMGGGPPGGPGQGRPNRPPQIAQ